MKCTWDKKLIYKLYKNPTSKEELSGLLLTYFEFLDTLVNTRFPIKKMLDLDCSFINNNSFLESINDEFVTKSHLCQNPEADFMHYFSKEDILDLTASFYNSLEPDFQKAFAKLYAKRYGHLRFINPINSRFFVGSTFHSPSEDETFIAARYNKNLSSLITLIHEYAHAIAFQINKSKSIEVENQVFCEIESIFMELVALEFFEKNFPELQNDIDASRIESYNTAVEDATIMHYKIDFKHLIKEFNIDINDKNTLQLLKFLKDETILPLSHILYIFQISADMVCKYPIGTLIAIELYNIYLQDPQEAFALYRQIICFKDLPNDQIYEEIKKMGITPSANIESFERKLRKN